MVALDTDLLPLPIDDLTPVDAFTLPSPARIGAALRDGRCPPDAAFDTFLPKDLRDLAGEHWTPLAVALAAARWLVDAGVRQVVDIGSGPGKFCVAAALAGSCELIGLEQSARLVSVARSLSRLFGVPTRARFIQGTLAETKLPEADAYYLYNPFMQHLCAPNDDPGYGPTPDYQRYRRDVTTMQEVFRRAPAGTIVLTYNGFGGLMPANYEACRVSRELPCVLRMWRKSVPGDDGRFSTVDAD
jgi:SAM-dependent methyltransferase